jgi:4-hydroxybenzoate polyprenyltransferase
MVRRMSTVPPYPGSVHDLSASGGVPPLCVDLDGTLVKSDTLVDSTLALARQKPAALLQLPGWLMQGKAALKRHITANVNLDVVHLPYNQPLLAYLREQYAAGRPIYLATAADAALARRVADHLGIFAGVLASDGSVNLAGGNKLAAFRERFGDCFSYIGNASPDLPLLIHCSQQSANGSEAMVANPHGSLSRSLRSAGVVPTQRFDDTTHGLKVWMRALRLHQWAKNVLIFVPLLLAHVRGLGPLVGSLIAFFSFSLCASATYIVNDLLDIEADRKHHRKRKRPFASGDLSAITGCMVVGLFLLISLVLAIALPRVVAAIDPIHALARPLSFLFWLAVYTVSTLAYSLRLKRVVLLDVIVLSGLYTVRILAGSAATGVLISPWLAGFSIFFFLSLAFVKRFAELESLRQRDAAPANGRGYLIADLEQLRALGSAAGYVSVVVLTFYISTLDAANLYSHTVRLWLLVPVMLLWISRLWLLAGRNELHEDPVVYAITDKLSLGMGVAVAAIVLSAL